jgi:hypothetical protein
MKTQLNNSGFLLLPAIGQIPRRSFIFFIHDNDMSFLPRVYEYLLYFAHLKEDAVGLKYIGSCIHLA